MSNGRSGRWEEATRKGGGGSNGAILGVGSKTCNFLFVKVGYTQVRPCVCEDEETSSQVTAHMGLIPPLPLTTRGVMGLAAPCMGRMHETRWHVVDSVRTHSISVYVKQDGANVWTTLKLSMTGCSIFLHRLRGGELGTRPPRSSLLASTSYFPL